MQQLTLNMRLQDGARLASFYQTAANAELMDFLQHLLEGYSPLHQLLIWGGTGVGKSHILQAACFAVHQQKRQAFYLPLKTLSDAGPTILQGLNNCQLLCLDDVDSIIGDKAWEKALLTVLQEREADNNTIILSMTEIPTVLNYILPDLKARFMWSAIHELQALKEDDVLQALQLRARQRGFALSEQILHYIYKKKSHDLPTMLEVLERLDACSLQERHVLNLAFVKRILADLDAQA